MVLAKGCRSRAGHDRILCSLASSSGPVVHPDTAEPVLNHIAQMASGGDPRIICYNEESAARAVFIRTLQAGHLINDRILATTGAALQCLEALRRDGGLPGRLVSDLTAKGALPA